MNASVPPWLAALDAAALAPFEPPPRMLMGPGPINAYPSVQRAMSAALLGQFDPAFRQAMVQTQALYRAVFETTHAQTLMIDGTARSAIECVMWSLIEPGDRVLVASFGRFGQLKAEIARRIGAVVGAEVVVIDTPWGTVFTPEAIEAAIVKHRPTLLATCQGDTSTTMLQPLEHIGPLARRHGVWLQVDATASIVGTPLPVDAWQIDCVTAGLQKCLGGPSGIAPVTLSDAMAARIQRRRHIEEGIRPGDYVPGSGPRIASNYFDLAMILDYWSPRALNHHTEATSMLYAARECARLFVQEGRDAVFARHAACSSALMAGLRALGLSLYGDLAHKMPNVTGVFIPPGIDGERVRRALLTEFNLEIGTSFGPLAGRIWRIGTMGFNARPDCVYAVLGALEAVLHGEGHRGGQGAVAAAREALAG
jgi:(S)-ureidoglycine-glyoxylate aminotransferase